MAIKRAAAFGAVLNIILLAAVGLSCDFGTLNSSEPRYATLRLAISQGAGLGSRTILPSIDMTIVGYDIFGDGPDDEVLNVSDFGVTQQYTNDQLAIGEWTITVTAKNSVGEAIGTGSATITLRSETPVLATIMVRPYEGTGTISIIVRWEAGAMVSPTVVATERLPNGTTVPSVFLPGADGHSLVWLDTAAPTGFHELDFVLKDGIEELAGDSPAIRVVMDQVSQYAYEYSAAELALRVSKPVLELGAGSYGVPQTLTISCATSGVTIKYTNNGTFPNAVNGRIYTGPISINSTQTIRAIALLSNAKSTVAKAAYVISDSIAVPLFGAMPGLYYSPVEVALSCPTVGAYIRYTVDGNTPSATVGMVYSVPLLISADTTIIAVAVGADGTTLSDPTTEALYRVTGHIVAPTAAIASGTYTEVQAVALSCSTEDSVIYYTTNGQEPTSDNGTLYTTPIDIDRQTTLKATASRTDWETSPVMTETYLFQVASPAFSVPVGTYPAEQSVALAVSTPKAMIRYTTDGTEPSVSAGDYFTSPVVVERTRTIKAIAFRDGWLSASAQATYELKVPVPVVSPPPGAFFFLPGKPVSVRIDDWRSNTAYVYETDGDMPTDLSNYYDAATGIVLQAPAELSIIAKRAGWTDSDPIAATYDSVVVPAAGVNVHSFIPTLDWPTDIFASSYSLQVSADAEFTTPLALDRTGITESVCVLTSPLMNGGAYYWRVAMSYPDASESVWQGPWSFYINVNSDITIISELANPLTVTLSGQTAVLADEQTMTVMATVTPAAAVFAWYLDGAAIPDENGAVLNIPATGIKPGRHVILCRATIGPRYGSATVSFQREESDDLTPILVSPANGTGSDDLYPTFDWSDRSGAVGYRFQLSADPDFSPPIIDDATLVSSTYTPTIILPYSDYWWRVATKGEANGVWVVWSETRSFIYDFFNMMIPISSGTFQMGSSSGYTDELPIHDVTLSSYWLSKNEITQTQYQTVTGDNPSYFTGDLDRPVEQVTWYDAVEFCNKLSVLEGRDPVYTIVARSPASGYPITSASVTMDRTKNGYRLPTEAEWEYAARGGASSAGYTYSGSNSAGNVAWYGDNASSTTHLVGLKAANELGLHDMSGNVGEWCWDWLGTYPSAASTDPIGASSGASRVMRGGAWYGVASNLRSADRFGAGPEYRCRYDGFRVLLPQSGP